MGNADSDNKVEDEKQTEKKEIKEDIKESDDTPSDKKNDVDSLRKVIKVDESNDKKNPKEETIIDTHDQDEGKTKKENNEKKLDVSDLSLDDNSSREALEQKRAILQNIKDFDFQIKKNQEDIGGLNKKLDSMSKDLDDLVSLYEIVSEQMNPFVGLSKVTKKRLDALESFTREIDNLKERTAELESFAERSGARLQSVGEIKQEVKKIDADALIAEMDKKSEGNKKEQEIKADTELKDEENKNIEEIKPEQQVIQKENNSEQNGKNYPLQEEKNNTDVKLTTPKSFESTPTYVNPDFNSNISQDLYDMDLDMIFEMAFESLSAPYDNKIDMIIDEFIESLKG